MDDRQKDRDDSDWNQEYRKQRVAENENSDDVERREQNNRWLESLEKVRHSRNTTKQAGQDCTQTHDKVQASKREPARNTCMHSIKYEQQQHQRQRRKSKNKTQTTTKDNHRSTVNFRLPRLLQLRRAEQVLR